MKISVLIPTLGREKELIDTIEQLMKQSRIPDEIVVVDQNGDRFPALDRFLAGISIVKQVKAPTPGISVNYNRCVENATGDVVLYLDDDVLPDPKLVETHLANYANPSIGGVAGRVLEATQTKDPASIRRVGLYCRWTGGVTTDFNGMIRQEAEIAQGANMSFRREALLKIGGFDRGYGGNGYYFETDGCLRLLRAGYRIVFDPKAELKHWMAPSGGARVKDKARHTYYYIKNGVRLVRRHSPAPVLFVFSLRALLYCLAKAAYNHDARIFLLGMRALAEGLTQSMEVAGI